MARATPSFRLHLFGAFQLERDAQIIHLPTRKIESLLAYLALFPEQHPREKLATIFWGDTSDDQARASLRNALAVLRKHIADDILQADRDSVQLNPDCPLWVDARAISDFTQYIQLSNSVDQSEIQNLQSAMDLYRGDLLIDYYDEWIPPERERLRTLYIDTLLKLAQQMRSQSDYAHAIELSDKILALDSGNEKAHQNLMFCYLAAGNRRAALKQYEECERVLRQEIGVEPLPETQSLYQWVKRAEQRASSPEARLTNLPAPLTDFIGRLQETTELLHLITQKRLVTLTGAGGCGKTRWAIHVASQLIDTFHDGVWWVGLAPITDSALVPQAIAYALGVRESSNQPLMDTLVNYLRGKHLLLLIDSCEHLIQACAVLTETVLSQCVDLHILTTGREPLNIAGETVWQVSALGVPNLHAVADRQFVSANLIDEMMRYDSVRLFVNRAAASKPSFALTDQNARAIGEICARLDGIPLAIELAAARVKTLTVLQIAERLNDRFRLLTDGSRTALPHHQTLRAAIDWSYDSLSDAERVLFRRLSAFIGGWTLEAAEQIASDDGRLTNGSRSTPLTRAEILDVLTHLVTKSLVVVESSSDDVRYRILETVREYAREKLIESDEAAEFYTRHRDWFLAFAEATESKLQRAGQMLWLDQLEADFDNLRAALRWSLRRADAGALDFECGLRLVGALRQFWAIRSYLSEGRTWFARALQVCASPQSIENNPALQLARAKALTGAGILAYLQGDQVRAAEFSEQSVVLARSLNDKRLIASSLFVLGEYQRNHLQDMAQAQTLVEEGLVLVREEGDDWLTAVLLINAGLQSRLQGDYARAAALFEEGLAHIEKVGDKWIASVLLDSLGSVAFLQGEHLRAVEFFERALGLRRELKDQNGVAGSLNALGQALRCQGDLARALKYFEESLALWQEFNHKDGMGQVMQNIARVVLRQGDVRRATTLFRQSLQMLSSIGAHENVFCCITGVLGVLSVRGRYAQVAYLFGALESRRASLGLQLPPADCADYEQWISTSRAALGDADFRAAWEAGRNLSLEQAADFALAELEKIRA